MSKISIVQRCEFVEEFLLLLERATSGKIVEVSQDGFVITSR